MTAAQRARRYRDRRSSGLTVLAVEIDEVDHVEKLIAAGFLPASKSEDREAIAKATARLLAAIEVADIHPRHA
jgi:hypothetical protein